MRTSILLFLLFILPFVSNAQWTWSDVSADYGQTDPFGLGLYVVDDNTVWSIPFWLNGTVNPKCSVTSDGGETWTVNSPDLGNSQLVPVLVYALNADTAWITTQQMPNGTYGSVHVTYDGGTTWSELDIPYVGNEVPLAVHFYNAMEGIVVAQNFFTSIDHTHIYRTTDGGDSWANVSPDLEAGEVMWVYNGESIMERIGDRLYIGTGLGRVLRSTDRGMTWDIKDVELGNRRGMNAVAFEDEMTGIIMSAYHLDSLNTGLSSGYAVAAKTTNGGDTWTPIEIPLLLEHIEYVPNSGGVYIGGSGYTGWAQYYVSRDGGFQWEEKGAPGMINIVFNGPESGYATTFGIENGIVKYEGESLLYDESPLPESDWEGQGTGLLPYANFVDNFINDITIIDEQSVWGITTSNRVSSFAPHSVKTSDGGETWNIVSIPGASGRRGYDIHAFNDQRAFVTTNNNGGGLNRLMETNDGGISWTVNKACFACGGNVHFFNGQEGLIINDNQIEVTIDGGENWVVPSSMPSLISGDIVDLSSWADYRTSAYDNHYWYLGDNNNILISNDKGQNWEMYDTPVAFKSMAMQDSLNGLAVETFTYDTELYYDSTTVFQTIDGGQTWEVRTTMADEFTILYIEHVKNTSNSYIGSSLYNSSTCFTNDGGQTWELIGENFLPGIARFLDHETGWIVRSWVNQRSNPIIYKWVGEAFPEMMVDVAETINKAPLVNIYPSPFSDYLTVDLNDLDPENTKIEMLDINGRTIRTYEANENNKLNDLSDLPVGAYLIKITTAKFLYTQKVLKQ